MLDFIKRRRNNGYRKTYGKVNKHEIENLIYLIDLIDLTGNGVIYYN